MSRDGIIKAAGNVFIADAAMELLGNLNPHGERHTDDVVVMIRKLRMIRDRESHIADIEPLT